MDANVVVRSVASGQPSETAGLALGPAVFLGVLAITGFVSKTAGETVVQPESALTGIALGFSVVPAILVAISLVVLRNYRTEQEFHSRERKVNDEFHSGRGELQGKIVESANLEKRAADILSRLRSLREQDAPTHGGRVLSYVYDSGLAALDELAADAARLVQPVNGLDPTVFPSTAVMERELVAFAREFLHGASDPAADTDAGGVVVGNVTSGGTESCVLAVKAARDFRGLPPGEGSLVLPTTAHAAFHKAAHLLGLELILVPVDPTSGRVGAQDIATAVRKDTVLIVVSAPQLPVRGARPDRRCRGSCSCTFDFHCMSTPASVGLRCRGGVICHPGIFRVPGVTSMSVDFHKYGYSPKGVSVLLHRGRDLHRKQYFGLTDWPGYPVVNPTLLGSKSVAALAGAWAIFASPRAIRVRRIGVPGAAGHSCTDRHGRGNRGSSRRGLAGGTTVRGRYRRFRAARTASGSASLGERCRCSRLRPSRAAGVDAT